MAHFNLADYQTVQERVDLFRKTYETGRITTEIVYIDEKSIIVKASVYLNATDTEPTCVIVTGKQRD